MGRGSRTVFSTPSQSGGDGTPGPDVELSDEELAYWSERLTRCNEANPDFNAALVVAAAVTTALYARARTGEGQRLETRMMASNAYALSEHFIDYPGRPPRVMPDAGVHGLHALYRLYETQDGWVFLAAPDDLDLARLCEALGLPGLRDDARFDSRAARAQHDAELGRELAAAFGRERVEACERKLTAARVACVQAYDGSHAAYIFDAPWGEKLGLVEEVIGGIGPYRRYGRVVRTERDVGPLGAADLAGAQTRSILAELGYATDEVEAMVATGIVGTPG